MKYLRVFENEDDYQAFNGGGDFVTPNICFIKTEEKMAFNKEIIEEEGFEILEIK
jgi:hypothetical protein